MKSYNFQVKSYVNGTLASDQFKSTRKKFVRPPIGYLQCVIELIFLLEFVTTILFLRDCVNLHACVMRENVEKCA